MPRNALAIWSRGIQAMQLCAVNFSRYFDDFRFQSSEIFGEKGVKSLPRKAWDCFLPEIEHMGFQELRDFLARVEKSAQADRWRTGEDGRSKYLKVVELKDVSPATRERYSSAFPKCSPEQIDVLMVVTAKTMLDATRLS